MKDEIKVLEAELKNEYANYSYYSNTDDIHSWRKETAAREKCAERIEELKAELARLKRVA